MPPNLEQKVESLEKQNLLLSRQMESLVQTVQVYAAVINVLASKLKVTDEEIKANLASQGIKIVGSITEDQQSSSGDGSGDISGRLPDSTKSRGSSTDSSQSGPANAAGANQDDDLPANGGSD